MNILNYWNHIYDIMNPVAFSVFSFKVYWYSLMYITALFIGFAVGRFIIKRDNLPISTEKFDSFFIWAEIGIIIGARIGFIFIYDPNRIYYLLNPWQIFNPFQDGSFVGIRGMSYHGAVLGFLVATFLFSRIYKMSVLLLMDLVAVCGSAGYFFGRIGNFLNQELIGRVTTVPWGIYVDGVLRHPSQIYEALLEGLVVFLILFFYRNHKKFDGELICLYGICYGVARFIAEFWRQPDVQIGFLLGWVTMGQMLSIILFAISLALYLFLYNKKRKYVKI